MVGREYVLWSRGILDRLPPEVGHAVVDGWVDGDETVIVMRDLGDSVLTWADRLTRGRCRWMLTRVAAQHRAFLGAAPDYLTPLPNLIALFAPDRMAPFVNSTNPLAAIYIRGWEVFGETVPAEVADPVFALLTDPKPLANALQSRPTTLIHGDLATVNMAFSDGELTLLDWAMPAVAPGAVDIARFVAGCASVVDMSREQIIADYALAAGPASDETAMRLSLLGALCWLGWNKALDAAEHPDPVVRAREQQDVRQLCADHLIHRWDLAAATGGDTSMDPQLVAEVGAWFAEREAMYRGSGAIGPRASAAGDPHSDLLAAFGRTSQGGPNHAALARFSAAFGSGDVDVIMARMTDDCVFESTGPSPDGKHHDGQAAVRAVWEQFFRETKNPKFTDEDTFLSGDRACVRWRFTWTSHDGSEGHVRGVDVIRFRDGLVAEKLSYVKG